jgi:acyl-coenzyme A synthetase/AMP-(fatty) acid ligase
VMAATKKQLAPFKVPKSVIVVDELPKTSTGKIQKNVVRTMFADHYRAG